MKIELERFEIMMIFNSLQSQVNACDRLREEFGEENQEEREIYQELANRFRELANQTT